MFLLIKEYKAYIRNHLNFKCWWTPVRPVQSSLLSPPLLHCAARQTSPKCPRWPPCLAHGTLTHTCPTMSSTSALVPGACSLLQSSLST